MRFVAACVLVALLASCTAEDRRSAAANDSPRCETSPGAGGCSRADRPRPDDNWRTSGFGSY